MTEDPVTRRIHAWTLSSRYPRKSDAIRQKTQTLGNSRKTEDTSTPHPDKIKTTSYFVIEEKAPLDKILL